MTAVRPRVVVVGSGFGGLNAALHLASAPVEIVVVDRDNYHGFWPLLYQVATAGLGADDIAHPIRAIYGPHPNISVRLGTVTGVDLDARVVHLARCDGPSAGGGPGGPAAEPSLPYDFLILAAGSATSDFGISGVAEHAFPLKTLPDAVRLRNHVLSTFEAADADPRGGGPGALTVVLVGGGSTGVEMAGALSELIGRNLAADFRHLDVASARVIVVEMADHLLPGFGPTSQAAAYRTLTQKGVQIRLSTRLAQVDAGGVTLEGGERIEAATVVWTAGIQASPLSAAIAGDKGKGGAIEVGPDLSLPGHPEVFVIGDLAARRSRRGQPLPQVAQVAIQGGKHAARTIRRRLGGRRSRPFRYHDHGTMATIGRRSAVAELPGGIALHGTVGWLAWLAVHLVFLVGFRNRAVVLVNWAYNYLTWDRATRVILDNGYHTATGQRRA
ncbi:MAG: NAD(P)/FAD-dependent oxidoreductase [Actinomycetes bacterium]